MEEFEDEQDDGGHPDAGDVSFSGSEYEDEKYVNDVRTPQTLDHDEHRVSASFSLKHPLHGIDPLVAAVAVFGLGFAAVVMLGIKRLTRKRLDISSAWLCQSKETQPKASGSRAVLGLPLLSQRLAVCEKCVYLSCSFDAPRLLSAEASTLST